MNELNINGSGCNDPTASEAIRNVERIRRGDIYYIEEAESYVGQEMKGGRPAVIVSNDVANRYSPVVEVVYLTTAEKKPLPTHAEVVAQKISTALCEQITSVSVERLGRKRGECSADEMSAIDAALRVSLGLPEVTGETELGVLKTENKALREELDEAEYRLELAQGEYEKLADKRTASSVDVAKIEAERDTYKHLYTSLLERMIGGAANV